MGNAQSLKPLFGLSIIPAAKDAHAALAQARLTDDSGLDLIAVQDHPYLGHYVDTWTLLAMMGAITQRVRLLPDVLNLPLLPKRRRRSTC